MNSLTKTISLKRWHAFVLLAMSGYTVGSIIAKVTTALGV
jgi:hypothetical protein